MDIRFYNTLTNQAEPFKPLEPPVVRLYSCGPTVYDYAHVGNFRTFLFSDLLRRFLEAADYDVRQIMNITDVGHMTDDEAADGSGEDKMAVSARRLKEAKKSGVVDAEAVQNPDDPYQVAQYYTDAFIEDGKKLGMKIAFEYPEKVVHATQHIAEMQDLITRLIEKDHAYLADDGVVYFSVESFAEYGRLSGNSIDRLREGEGGRVSQEHQANKRHPADFFLWKPDPTHIMNWDSPWGVGYPGWHVECSAMAMKHLEREVIDIHTGGEDNIFPHHECEIAQSCCATGNSTFATLWMHPRHLFVEGQKMSKSKGTFYTVRQILAGDMTGRPVHPSVLRYELTKSHYRQNTNFTAKGLVDSANTVRRLREFRADLETRAAGVVAEVDASHPVLSGFMNALADDLNISAAMAVVFGWMSKAPGDAAEALAVFERINHVLNIAPLRDAEGQTLEFKDTVDSSTGESIDADAHCRSLDEARAGKDYATADRLRQELVDAGFEVRTGPEGTAATRKLA